ncbi:hypothetical protein L0337_00305 [candidate division KSB1 bacterium]|nr:hypothetical protein [candidate division KSB1 bacterium]
MSRQQPGVLELLVGEAAQLGADTLEVEYRDGYEEVVAYTSGDSTALQRIKDYYQPKHTPNLDQFRVGVRERLGRPSKSENGNDNLMRIAVSGTHSS